MGSVLIFRRTLQVGIVYHNTLSQVTILIDSKIVWINIICNVLVQISQMASFCDVNEAKSRTFHGRLLVFEVQQFNITMAEYVQVNQKSRIQNGDR